VKTIGVLGGLGPQATMDFEARVHAAAQRLIPQQANTGYPPMIVYYLRRPPFVMGPDFRPVLPLQPEPQLIEAARQLGPLVDFLVITANGPHALQSQIEAAAGRPVLSIIALTVAEVRSRGWRRVGVIGMGGPHAYAISLSRLGIAMESLPADLQEQFDRSVIALYEGAAGPGARRVAHEAVAFLRRQAIDGIVLGCTDLPLLLDQDVADPSVIDPTQLLAEAAVRQAMQEASEPGTS
jgi:aspartate racemase